MKKILFLCATLLATLVCSSCAKLYQSPNDIVQKYTKMLGEPTDIYVDDNQSDSSGMLTISWDNADVGVLDIPQPVMGQPSVILYSFKGSSGWYVDDIRARCAISNGSWRVAWTEEGFDKMIVRKKQ